MSGRKRHIVVDTTGLLLAVVVHAANIQDRDGAKLVPSGKVIWADAAYGPVGSVGPGNWVLSVVRRKEVLPRRWVVERTLRGWDGTPYEELPETGETWIHVAMVCLMLKRLKPT